MLTTCVNMQVAKEDEHLDFTAIYSLFYDKES